MNPEIFGTIAATLTTVCFIPQAWRVIRTKDTYAISAVMYSLFTVGVFFWLIYGTMLGSLPMIIANIITFTLALTILIFKLRETPR